MSRQQPKEVKDLLAAITLVRSGYASEQSLIQVFNKSILKKYNILAIEERSERERYDQRLIPKIRLYERVEDKPVVKKQKVEEVPVLVPSIHTQ